ncbi:MAG: hypothetical protein LBI10_05605 [Deltaproteobacteria bacterium]|nr:hypothetical protein [Deltaproteobacteria bacterium]
MGYSFDYYTWIYLSDLLTGGNVNDAIGANILLNRLVYDAFGTYIIINFVATAHFNLPLDAAASISVTFLVWGAAAIYALIRQVFGLNFWLSALLTLGVAFGGLYNYVSICGMFGHQLALVAFLVALTQFFPAFGEDWPTSQVARRVFFPLFFLLLSYQAGYQLFAIIIVFAGFLLAYFNLTRQKFISKVIKSIGYGLRPVLYATIVSAILAPGSFAYMIRRIFEVAAQTAGWGLPFFSPWHFSGIPYYSPNAFLVPAKLLPADGLTLATYLPLIGLTAALAFMVYFTTARANQPLQPANDKSLKAGPILTLTIVYLLSLAGYLGLSFFFGHFYQIWKFPVYVILPLSFVPLGLFFLALKRLAVKKLTKLPALAAFLLVSVLGLKFAAMPALTDWPFKYYSITSANSFINALKSIKSTIPKNFTVIIDFKSYARKFIAALMFTKDQFKNINLIFYSFYFLGDAFFYNLINNNTIIVSDSKFDHIYNLHNTKFQWGDLYIYDYDKINNNGYIAFKSGSFNFDWTIDLLPLHAAIKLPKDKIGQELNISVTLKPKDNAPPNSNNRAARLGILLSSGETIWSDWANSKGNEGPRPKIAVPAELTAKGSLWVIVELSPRLNEPYNPKEPSLASRINEFDILNFDIN